MNTTPHDLLTRAADEIDVPVPDTAAILRAGHRQRRRSTLRRTVPLVGLAAASVVAAAILVQPATERSVPTSVAVTEMVPASFSPAETAQASRAYAESGAFTIGSTLYLGADDPHPVELSVPAVRGLYPTSAGVLVRHGRNAAMDVASRYSLVGTDGSVLAVDLDPGDVVVGTDPTQPYLAYAVGSDDSWTVLVVDLRTGEVAARRDVAGDFAWGGWDAPPVSLSGDVVWIGMDEETVALDWRSGEQVDSALPGNLAPTVNGGRQVLEDLDDDQTTTGFRVVDARSGDVLLDVPVTSQEPTLGRLSPDGKSLVVGPYLEVGEDGQVRDTEGTRVIDVASGRSHDLPTSPIGGYGWTPTGQVFSVDGQQAVVCDVRTQSCTRHPLALGTAAADLGTLKLAGLVTDS